MSIIQDKIAQDFYELRQDFTPTVEFTPAVEGDLTHDQIRGMLVTVRRLKTRLEVLDAELEEN